MQVYRVVFISAVCGAIAGFFAGRIEISFPGNAHAENAKIIQARAFNLIDDSGRLRGQFAMAKEGQPGLWIMDSKGTARVNLGVYEDSTGYVGLNDQNGLIVQLLRSFGPGEAPLHIFKTGGQDMMITGLNPGAKKKPFLFFYDDQRARKIQFGEYSGP